MPFDRTGGELLFNLLTDRYEWRATVVTTNLAFAESVTVFAGDEKLTTALLDRLAHHAVVLTTKGKSYRMRKRRTTREEPSRSRRADPGHLAASIFAVLGGRSPAQASSRCLEDPEGEGQM